MITPEVLAPVGDKERLISALDYGADAVYLGSKQFTMRAAPASFTGNELKEAVDLAHSKDVRVYLTCNTLPRNNELSKFGEFLDNALAANVDAVITADLGLLSLIKSAAPELEVHMSTQTGIVNYATANMLYNMGVKRVVLARELSLDEIAEIRAKTPKDLEIEVFVHGAMCVSFSGRCLLSAYLTDRDANRGACAQPCRWKYHLMEETREGQYFPIIENDTGTYILNAKDLCMIDYIPELVKAGVTSLKIEGRAKSAYYVSVITNAYRCAVDAWKEAPDKDNFVLPEWIKNEVFQVSHREYCTGFFFGHPKNCQRYADNNYVKYSDVVAMVDYWEDGKLYITQRNRFFADDILEGLIAGKEPVKIYLGGQIWDENGELVEVANHAMMKYSIPCETPMPPRTFIRKLKPA